MSETNGKEQAAPATVPGGNAPPEQDIGDFIEKEKAEVYLLMDFLSGRADKKIRDEKISVLSLTPPAAGVAPSLVETSLIDAVCQVRWPPDTPAKNTQANIASILLKARDRLSEIANPASGGSIAFTTFVTNDMSSAITRKTPKRAEAHHVILSNAKIAYPHYENLAQSFNRRRFWVGVSLPLCLAVTIAASFAATFYLGGAHDRVLKTFQDVGLPVLYGLVGALAGVLRGVQVRIREGLLMPRDRMHILMQLWLGVVMGATIGLFKLGSMTTATTPTALAFIAGLGVDSVFLWLESLIRTIFGNKLPSSPGTTS